MFQKIIASVIFIQNACKRRFPVGDLPLHACKRRSPVGNLPKQVCKHESPVGDPLKQACKHKFPVGDFAKLSDFLVVRGKNGGGIQIFFRVFQKLGLFSGLRNP